MKFVTNRPERKITSAEHAVKWIRHVLGLPEAEARIAFDMAKDTGDPKTLLFYGTPKGILPYASAAAIMRRAYR